MLCHWLIILHQHAHYLLALHYLWSMAKVCVKLLMRLLLAKCNITCVNHRCLSIAYIECIDVTAMDSVKICLLITDTHLQY